MPLTDFIETAPGSLSNVAILGAPHIVTPFFSAWKAALGATMTLGFASLLSSSKPALPYRLLAVLVAFLTACTLWPGVGGEPDQSYQVRVAHMLPRLVFGFAIWRTWSGRTLLPMAAILVLGLLLIPSPESFPQQ